jgi:hypothetical protein
MRKALSAHKDLSRKRADSLKYVLETEWILEGDCPNAIELHDDDLESMHQDLKCLYAEPMPQRLHIGQY